MSGEVRLRPDCAVRRGHQSLSNPLDGLLSLACHLGTPAAYPVQCNRLVLPAKKTKYPKGHTCYLRATPRISVAAGRTENAMRLSPLCSFCPNGSIDNANLVVWCDGRAHENQGQKSALQIPKRPNITLLFAAIISGTFSRLLAKALGRHTLLPGTGAPIRHRRRRLRISMGALLPWEGEPVGNHKFEIRRFRNSKTLFGISDAESAEYRIENCPKSSQFTRNCYHAQHPLGLHD